MSNSIEINKLKRIMYSALRWRLQLPNYSEHNPIPKDSELNEFSRGVKCAYRDLLQEIDKVENADNQRRIWKKRTSNPYDDEQFVDEIRNYD